MEICCCMKYHILADTSIDFSVASGHIFLQKQCISQISRKKLFSHLINVAHTHRHSHEHMCAHVLCAKP